MSQDVLIQPKRPFHHRTNVPPGCPVHFLRGIWHIPSFLFTFFQNESCPQHPARAMAGTGFPDGRSLHRTAGAAVTNQHGLARISCSSGGWKFRSRCWESSCRWGPPPGSQTADCSPRPRAAFPWCGCVRESVPSPLLQGALLRPDAHPRDLMESLQKAAPPNTHTGS